MSVSASAHVTRRELVLGVVSASELRREPGTGTGTGRWRRLPRERGLSVLGADRHGVRVP